jgi:hypothetical protein
MEHFVVLAREPVTALDAIRKERELWQGRGARCRLIEIGSVFGVKGSVFDNRSYVLADGPYPTRARALQQAEGYVKRHNLAKVATLPQLEYPRSWPAGVHVVGPLVPHAAVQTMVSRQSRFLQSGSSPVLSGVFRMSPQRSPGSSVPTGSMQTHFTSPARFIVTVSSNILIGPGVTGRQVCVAGSISNCVLRGTIAGQATTHDVTFDWMLGREYVQMHEVSRERAANGTPAYEAVVLFGRDPRSGEYACLWLDNTGVSAFDPQGTGRGSVAGDSIPFVFRYTATTGFHTTFIYTRATDSWQWHMDNDSVGVRRSFARVALTRR